MLSEGRRGPGMDARHSLSIVADGSLVPEDGWSGRPRRPGGSNVFTPESPSTVIPAPRFEFPPEPGYLLYGNTRSGLIGAGAERKT